MTAKELKEQFLKNWDESEDDNQSSPTKFEKDFNKFCKQLCEEQREICSEAFQLEPYGRTTQDLMETIENAKMPEL